MDADYEDSALFSGEIPISIPISSKKARVPIPITFEIADSDSDSELKINRNCSSVAIWDHLSIRPTHWGRGEHFHLKLNTVNLGYSGFQGTS